jgi:UDP-MurNAc hydroxylase
MTSTMRATSIGHAGILVETRHGSIVCDPWFVPAFFGSWFVFPRNDHLRERVRDAIEHPDYLYISHLHGDHLDAAFLAEHIDRTTTVLLPGYPTDELERTLRAQGFRNFVHTEHGVPVDLGGLTIEIHVETSLTDGPGGDSALIVDDGQTRLLDQNDCRLHDLAAVTAHGPIDCHWLQYSGAIWYPMVYEMEPEAMRAACEAKVEAQFARAVRYVTAVAAAVVIPSAGPPCFLDPDLAGFNVITGDEPSIFPDASRFLTRLARDGIDTGHLLIPGSAVVLSGTTATIEHAADDAEVRRPFEQKAEYLAEYQHDWQAWLAAEKASWPAARPDLVARLADWWEPLLARCPTLRAGVGAAALIRTGADNVLVDFPAGQVRAYAGEPFAFSFTIPRPLVERVLADRAVDWSNSLLLSCRFRAWRAGEFNEFLYNFLKSLSVERIERAEIEAHHKRGVPDDEVEEIERSGYVFERFCPHRRADLAVFGTIEDTTLTCHLHGWQFDLDTGRCLTADDRKLRVRPAAHPDE